MRKLFLPLFTLFLWSCNSTQPEQFTIHGKIIGKTPAKAYLQIYKDRQYSTIDSANFTNGEFNFTGHVDLPYLSFIKIGDTQPIAFFLENSDIEFNCHIDSLSTPVITGSKTNDTFYTFNQELDKYNKRAEMMYELVKMEKNPVLTRIYQSKLDSAENATNDYIKQFAIKNSDNVLAPYVINRHLIYYLELNELEDLINQLTINLRGSEYTKLLLDRADKLRSLEPGMDAPLFTQNDTANNPVSLADFKGKYVLIDFWASWCPSCREANPQIVEIYKKYKNKNFTILGVSFDKNKEKWVKAITDDKLTWTQVSALKGWENPAAEPYGVNSIPHSILIDPNGKIVKRSITPEKLDQLLNEKLK